MIGTKINFTFWGHPHSIIWIRSIIVGFQFISLSGLFLLENNTYTSDFQMCRLDLFESNKALCKSDLDYFAEV